MPAIFWNKITTSRRKRIRKEEEKVNKFFLD
jgi:hypothetical protein